MKASLIGKKKKKEEKKKKKGRKRNILTCGTTII
jgi:hypothetical protein